MTSMPHLVQKRPVIAADKNPEEGLSCCMHNSDRRYTGKANSGDFIEAHRLLLACSTLSFKDELSLWGLQAIHSAYCFRGVVGQLDVVSVKLKKITPAVRKYCQQEKIPISDWPVTVFPSQFHLGVVVSFGHLIPESIIDAFPLGILNVHGSLLPRWRGAAPVIQAVMNNDTETGITIMKIHPNRFDVGEIVSQSHIPIGWDTKSGQLTEGMAKLGAQELSNVLNDLKNKLNQEIKQDSKGVSKAPKVSEATSQILWKKDDCRRIQAKYRALDDHFPLWTTWLGKTVKLRNLVMKEELFQPKIKSTEVNIAIIDDLALKEESAQQINAEQLVNKDIGNEQHQTNFQGQKIIPGNIVYNKQRKVLSVYCKDGWVDFRMVIIKGKKPMTAGDFYNGFISKVDKERQHFN
ncbi:unnamed protein product, partial [Meganyctiphanes norvegica]